MIQNIWRQFGLILFMLSAVFSFAHNSLAAPEDTVNQPLDTSVIQGGVWCAGSDCYESESSCKSSEIDFLCTQTASAQMYCDVGYSGPARSANCYNSLDKCTDGIGWSSRDCVAVASIQELDEKMKVYEGVKLGQNVANATIDEIKALIEQEPATAEQKQAIQTQIDQKLSNMDNSVKNMQDGVTILSSGGAQLNNLKDKTVNLQGNINSLNADLRAWTANQPGGGQSGGVQPGGGQVDQIQTIAGRIESAQAVMNAAGLPGGKPGEMVYIPLEGMFITQTDTHLPNFLKFLFNTGVAIAGVSALVMLVIGGIMYVGSAGNQATATSAKGVIRDALLGVVMVFFTWLLLFVINPDLISIDDNLAKLTEGAQLKQLKPGEKATGVVRVPTDGGGGDTVGDDTGAGYSTLNSLSIPYKAGQGDKIETNTGQKLQDMNDLLKDAGITWRVTEAYPPTREHFNKCHAKGTCVDANFTGSIKDNPTANDIITFINAAKAAGLRPMYEVKTKAQADALISQGVPADSITGTTANGKDLGNWISGAHFSVYNN